MSLFLNLLKMFDHGFLELLRKGQERNYSFRAKWFLVICVICLTSLIGLSQNNKLTLKLKDPNGNPISWATTNLCSLDSTPLKNHLSDSNGYVNFREVKNGNYLLTIKSIAHADTVLIVKINKDTDIGTVVLQHNTLEGINIVYNKPIVESKGNLLTVNLEGVLLKGAGSVYELMERLPGITYSPQGTLMLRGRAGISVRIDGRQLYLSNTDLNNYLSSLNSDDIEKVEIVHTSDATEAAEGTGGIINIITKKGKKLGWNGSLNGGITKGKKWKGSSSININYRPSLKLNFYANYSLNKGNSIILFDNQRIIESNNVLIKEGIENNYKSIGQVGKAGMDYTFNSNHSIGLLININTSKRDIQSNSSIKTYYQNFLDTTINFSANTIETWNETSASIFYTYKLDSIGSKIDLNGDYFTFNNNSTSTLNSLFFYNDFKINDETRKNLNPSLVDLMSFKVDVTKMVKKAQFDVGLKTTLAATDNNFNALIKQGDDFINDKKRSNHFLYEEFIFAAYVNYQISFKSIDINAGLRQEYSEMRGNSLTLNNIFKNDVFALFPSFSFGKQIDSKNRLDLSYSRKINRPNYNDINPFEIYLTNYSSWRGNPTLKPQFVNNLSLTHAYKDFIWTTLSYSHTYQMFMPTIYQNDNTKTFYTTTTNFGASHFAGAFIYSSHSISSWWNMMNNGGIYFSQISDTRNQSDNIIFSGIQGYYLNSTNSFTLPQQYKVEVSGKYSGPNNGVWESKQYWSIDLGLSKEFKNNAQISVQFINVLNTIDYINLYNFENIKYRSDYIPELQKVRLTFSWPFGKTTVNEATQRKIGAEDEKNRVN